MGQVANYCNCCSGFQADQQYPQDGAPSKMEVKLSRDHKRQQNPYQDRSVYIMSQTFSDKKTVTSDRFFLGLDQNSLNNNTTSPKSQKQSRYSMASTQVFKTNYQMPDDSIYTGCGRINSDGHFQRHGKGQAEWEDGLKYDGDWDQNVQHGQGIETKEDGSKYQGEFYNGKKQGYGEYRWADGSLYRGQWYNDLINGNGSIHLNDGRKYVGLWKQSQMHGRGIFTWPDGRTYDGGYVNDKKQGIGKYSWPDGKYYEGQWLNGQQHGQGAFTNIQGITRKGIWNNGKRVKWLGEAGNDGLNSNLSSNTTKQSKQTAASEDDRQRQITPSRKKEILAMDL